MLGVHGHNIHSGAELTNPCSVGTIAACRCFNGGSFIGDHCYCPPGYGGPFCEDFVGEGKYVAICLSMQCVQQVHSVRQTKLLCIVLTYVHFMCTCCHMHLLFVLL